MNTVFILVTFLCLCSVSLGAQENNSEIPETESQTQADIDKTSESDQPNYSQWKHSNDMRHSVWLERQESRDKHKLQLDQEYEKESERVREKLSEFEERFIKDNNLQTEAKKLLILHRSALEKQLSHQKMKSLSKSEALANDNLQTGSKVKHDEDEYLFKSLGNLTCQDHVDFFDLPYKCIMDTKLMKNLNQYLKRSFFVIKANDQKYFLRIYDFVSRYELALMGSLKSSDVVLNLLEHKIKSQRFAGIYRYERNHGILYGKIRDTENFGLYDRYRISLEIARKVEQVFKYRDTKNQALTLNISPGNILMTKTSQYSFKLLSVFPKFNGEMIFNKGPENNIREKVLDKRAEMVYILGKIMYKLLIDIDDMFNSVEEIQNSLKHIRENPEQAQLPIDLEVLDLIRYMVNQSPVDRPYMEQVIHVLERVTNKGSFLFHRIWETLSDSVNQIQVELRMEEFTVKNHMSGKVEQDQVDMLKLLQDARTIHFDPTFKFDISDMRKYKELLSETVNYESDLTNYNGMVNDIRIEDRFDNSFLLFLRQNRVQWLELVPDLQDLLFVAHQVVSTVPGSNSWMKKYKKTEGDFKQVLIHSALQAVTYYEQREAELSESGIFFNHLANDVDIYVFGLLFALLVVLFLILATSLKKLNLLPYHNSHFDAALVT